MKNALLILAFFFIFGISLAQPGLKIFGSLSQIMHENDTSEKVRLNLLGPLTHYYGLGAVAGLDGEILIINGETYVTTVQNNTLATDKSTDVGATLLVLSEITGWDTLMFNNDLGSYEELEEFLGNQDYFKKPFPFIVLSENSTLKWHVVQPPRNNEQMQNHKELGLNGKYSGSFMVLGFFSTKHEGVFTHRGQNTHMHFQSADRLHAGHVDEIEIRKGDKLLIPTGL